MSSMNIVMNMDLLILNSFKVGVYSQNTYSFYYNSSSKIRSSKFEPIPVNGKTFAIFSCWDIAKT